MRIGLFIPCFIDAFFPEVRRRAVRDPAFGGSGFRRSQLKPLESWF